MNKNQQIQEKARKAEVIGIRRHCLGTDGDGVSTLKESRKTSIYKWG